MGKSHTEVIPHRVGGVGSQKTDCPTSKKPDKPFRTVFWKNKEKYGEN
jgi:hypothetical protein